MGGENYQLELMTGGADFSISCLVGKIVIGFFLVILFLVMCIVILSKIISPFDGKPPRAYLFIALNKSAPNFAAMDAELKKILADDRIKNYYTIKVFRSSDMFKGELKYAKSHAIMLDTGENILYEYWDDKRSTGLAEIPFTYENVLSMLKNHTYIDGEIAQPGAVRIERNPTGVKKLIQMVTDAKMRAERKKRDAANAAALATYDTSLGTITGPSEAATYTAASPSVIA